jgi:uncharacterized protein YbaP (TraB family)
MRVSARRLAVALAFAAALAGAAVPAHAAGPGAAASAPAPSCPPPAARPKLEEMVANAADHGPLWKATKDGRTVWLYGTIHVARASWAYPGPHVLRAIQSSDALALELDLGDPDMMQRLQKAVLARPGSPTLPDALHKRLLASMAAACIAPALLAPLRPEMQAVTVEIMQGRGMGLYPEFGIDANLGELARALGKRLRSLETPESQAELLVSDDPAETARAVGAVLDELEGGKSPAMLKRLAGDWERGDVDDMAAYASWCGCLDTPEQRSDFDKLIAARNPLMADRIVQWHGEGTSLFVAVGTLHMVGPIGLPTLLRTRGFQVERVSFADAR